MVLPRKGARSGARLRRLMGEVHGKCAPPPRGQAARIRWLAYLTSDHLPLATSISTTAFGS
jgi:hypothetical protein